MQTGRGAYAPLPSNTVFAQSKVQNREITKTVVRSLELLLPREMTQTSPDWQNKRPQGEDAREILIQIDMSDDRELAGWLYFCFLNKTLYFQDLGTMLLQLDEAMDEVGLPERTFEKRTGACFFPSKSPAHQPTGKETAHERSGAIHGCAPRAAGSRACLFEIHVYRRDHCSMQGTIQWARPKTQHAAFRSGLELMRLIRDAVSYQRDALRAKQGII